ncbi:MAG: HAMP domain-containing sensor histidine kinase, partial [Chloroflexota bacterium]
DGALSNTMLVPNVPFDTALVKLAQSGQAVISNTLVSGGNAPYAVAYLPVAPTGEASPAVLMVLVQLSDIAGFQNTTLLNTIIVFVVLTLLTVGLIYITLYRIAIRPIDTVRTIAQKMIGGEYDQRIPITSQDELGQLASTFNEMAGAVQQRETGLQKAREEAERADRAKSAFLASMSHELRTPLNSIINFTSFVLEGDTGPITEEQADLLNEVVKGSRHLLNLINDVLDMSKIEAGSLRLFVEDSIPLNTILSRVVTTGRSLLAEKPVQLTLEAEDLPLIRGDQQRILQIFLNIMSNACKFTEQGQIKVWTEQVDGEIVIAISDTGPGIPLEDRELIFQVFTQTNTGIKKGGGTGLGMPIAKSLAEAHGGRLWFESEPGISTTFYVALPVKSEILVPTLER